MNTQEKSLSTLKRYLTDYYSQIEKAKTAIETLENTSYNSD
ncbi:hypothetical protein [Gloeothece verrucosa]|uniref:Uncharacterized protein n=1 Tax=Gloeothece verrucosa (strain PCC 7822) TaxID=497965 RepID=E0UBI1_GLOV7|nr:hypothetical protein [Gloeothece verrucosa]ADN12813.1 hypothetical protein Cyan7822_0787 [Gloeothece verrucosa PCC 7822]